MQNRKMYVNHRIKTTFQASSNENNKKISKQQCNSSHNKTEARIQIRLEFRDFSNIQISSFSMWNEQTNVMENVG